MEGQGGGGGITSILQHARTGKAALFVLGLLYIFFLICFVEESLFVTEGETHTVKCICIDNVWCIYCITIVFSDDVHTRTIMQNNYIIIISRNTGCGEWLVTFCSQWNCNYS